MSLRNNSVAKDKKMNVTDTIGTSVETKTTKKGKTMNDTGTIRTSGETKTRKQNKKTNDKDILKSDIKDKIVSNENNSDEQSKILKTVLNELPVYPDKKLSDRKFQNWIKVNFGLSICLGILEKLFDSGFKHFQEKFIKSVQSRFTDIETELIKNGVNKKADDTIFDDSKYSNINKCIGFFKTELLEGKDLARSDLAQNIFRDFNYDEPHQWWKKDDDKGAYALAGAACNITKKLATQSCYPTSERFFTSWKGDDLFTVDGVIDQVIKNLKLMNTIRKDINDVENKCECDDNDFKKSFEKFKNFLNLQALQQLKNNSELKNISDAITEGLKKLDLILENKDCVNFKFLSMYDFLTDMETNANEIISTISSQLATMSNEEKLKYFIKLRIYLLKFCKMEKRIKDNHILKIKYTEINTRIIEKVKRLVNMRGKIQVLMDSLDPILNNYPIDMKKKAN